MAAVGHVKNVPCKRAVTPKGEGDLEITPDAVRTKSHAITLTLKRFAKEVNRQDSTVTRVFISDYIKII